MPPSRFYDIEAPETLVVTIPPELVLAEAAIVATPPVPIDAIPGSADLHGSLVCAEHGSYYTSFVTPSPPPPAPPPDVDNPFFSPPPSPPPHSPPSPPPAAGTVATPTPDCNNTERAVRDEPFHDLIIR